MTATPTTTTPLPKPEPKPVPGVANAAAAPKKLALSAVRASQMAFWSTYRLGIVGAKESGKTRLFATLSKFWKEDAQGNPLPASLDDIVYAELDEGGMNSIREWGIDCPVVPLDDLTDDDIFRALSDIPRILADEAKKYNARGVCIDTTTRLCKAVLNVLVKRGLDKAPLYSALAMELRKFFQGLRAVHCPLIYNFHIKPPPILEGADDAGVRLAAGIGASELELDVGGREAKNAIRDCCTHIYHLETTELPGKTQRILTANSRVESKRRMQKLMMPTMPPNLNYFFEQLAVSMNVPML